MAKDEDDAPKRKRAAGKSKKSAAGGDGAKAAEVSAVVDRIEDGGVAVLSLGDGKKTLDVPLSRLPDGAADGDHLRLTFDGEPGADTLKRVSKDEGSRAAAAERVSKMQERLERLGGAQGKKDFKL